MVLSIISIKAKFFNKDSVLDLMAYGYKFSKTLKKNILEQQLQHFWKIIIT